jgi:DNA-binding transcriptional MerR regulator
MTVSTAPPDNELTIDDLARLAKLPVRTIREYQTMRLLPPPAKRGRVGLYGADHARRLELISRLQRRGYSLAGIRDLLAAWDSGAGLPALLGVDIGDAALDETPLRLTHQELAERLGDLDTRSERAARAAGLIHPDGKDHVVVRSPALLALTAEGVAAGVPLDEMLEMIGGLRDLLTPLAEAIAEQIVERIWDRVTTSGTETDLEPLFRRGRILLMQGVASTLADRLGDALLSRADATERGAALRDMIDRVRVGVVVDSAGHLEHRDLK